MKFISKIHGEIEYEEKDIINFKKGIPGFEEYKKYILTDLKECEPFKLLQSLDKDEVGIIVKLTEKTIDSLNIKSPEEVFIITTVTLNSDVKKITTNLQGPIVINISNNLGEQIVVDNSKYKVKEPLMKE